MRLLLLFFILPFQTAFVHAVMFPVITENKILSCDKADCSQNVYYTGSSTVMEIGEPIVRPAGSEIIAYGIHCDSGDRLKGIPFSQCTWGDGKGGHAPGMTGRCSLKNSGSWELAEGSSCATASVWGAHSGAAPGGECVLFGQINGQGSLVTPMGIISAMTAANSGSSLCIKPLAPNVRCEVSLAPTIDHGALVAGTHDSKFIDGDVDCGEAAVVTVVGVRDILLAPGVRSHITTTMLSKTQVRVQSDMTVEPSAEPGEYAAAIIIDVSPY